MKTTGTNTYILFDPRTKSSTHDKPNNRKSNQGTKKDKPQP